MIKKLLIGALMLGALTSSAQKKKKLFNSLKALTEKNHAEYLPEGYVCSGESNGMYSYSKGKSLFISAFFKNSSLEFVSTNDAQASGIKGYAFDKSFVKGVPVEMVWLKGVVVVRLTDHLGNRKYVFYKPETLQNKK